MWQLFVHDNVQCPNLTTSTPLNRPRATAARATNHHRWTTDRQKKLFVAGIRGQKNDVMSVYAVHTVVPPAPRRYIPYNK